MFQRRFIFFPLCYLAFVFLANVSLDATKKPPLRPINLNTASSTQLQEVPGIGPVTADKILKMRKSYGPFKSVDDLRAIKGIGPKRLEKMRKYLTVAKPETKTAPKAASKNSTSSPKPSP
ncbi:MAG TPA: helix-hairpin-helix domain-containing protein [Candidatus Dormibacteraeota bacterium]|nr:helix-hairpin-helix domain-containing protein [Candidatus Dormibacteraeota bacterium]